MDWIKQTGCSRFVAAGLVSLTLAACSGSSPGVSTESSIAACTPGTATSGEDCGTVVLALTDIEGEFTSYTVDVLSVSLERASGERVELLPQAARIDFAQLTSLSELISATQLAPGDFVSGSVRLDYSEAEIFVEADGDIVAAEIYDTEARRLNQPGDASVVEVEIRLPDTERLRVRRGATAMLSIDFDLAASHLIDSSVSPVTAIAQAYLVAEVEPVDTKELRIRGALVSVDEDGGSYDVQLRPWYQRDGNFGVVTVHTSATTVYEIDGIAYEGAAGLEALAEQPAGTITVAFGTLNIGERRFTAQIVHAGDALGGDGYSAVLGNIVAREGDRLILKGALAIWRDRPAHFQRTVIVDIGPNTLVSKEGQADARFGPEALSVGQRSLILGEFTTATTDSADPFGPDIALVLDATEGKARMLVTRLTGSLVAAMPGRIEVKLRAIDRLSAELFDFSGTGINSAEDADPAAYEVALATLPTDALVTDRAVRVLGFVKAFGAAPPDFEARALIGPRDLPATLGVGWGREGTAGPFSALGPESLVIDLANPDIGLRHHMLIGYELVDLFELPASPLIAESALPRVYGISEPGHVELFKHFSDFVDELTLRLSNTDRARSLAAYGSYDEFNNALSAHKIVVYMNPAAAP